MGISQQLVIPGSLFLLTAGFGFWVGRLGKPYNQILFNIHKLIALGAVILSGRRIFGMNHLAGFPLFVVLLISITVLCVIALFASGAIMSIRDEIPQPALIVHRLSPALITISMFLALYFLENGPA